MKIKTINKNLKDIKSDIEIVFILKKKLKHKWVKNSANLKLLNFNGVGTVFADDKLYVGIDDLKHDTIRVAISSAIKKIVLMNVKVAKIGLYGKRIANITALVEGAILSRYNFDKYKSKKFKTKLKKLVISNEEYSNEIIDINRYNKDIENAEIVAKATNFTRDIVNSMPDELTPQAMAKIAEDIANNNNSVSCKIEDETYLKENGMGAFYAVSLASKYPARLIHLTHKPKNAKKKIVLIGKGLTYDSGGLSLKPAGSMVTMKSDKSGGSAVLGIIKAIAEMNLEIEVHGIIGATENMIGGNAFKPDDILTAKNGKTIEIKNTDAEGRLVLADCLCYAQDEIKNFDYILDFATLTGACVVALGEYSSGIMGYNKELKNKIINSADKSGELAVDLPFNKYLNKMVGSKIADICNIASGRYGGAITAGVFLSNFIKDKNRDKWSHIDIAGPAYVESEWGYNPFGASGAGVRMGVKFLEKLL